MSQSLLKRARQNCPQLISTDDKPIKKYLTFQSFDICPLFLQNLN